MDGIERLDFPVYAKAITPQGPLKTAPGNRLPRCLCRDWSSFRATSLSATLTASCYPPDDAPEILELSKAKLAAKKKQLGSLRTGALGSTPKHGVKLLPKRALNTCNISLTASLFEKKLPAVA